MLIASRFSQTTRNSHLFRHTTKVALASASHKARIRSRPSPISSQKIIQDVITQIRWILKGERRLQNLEGFIHKCLDKALLSTPLHQEVYEAVIGYLIKNMWPQPAASVYDRMFNIGFISSDEVDAKMLTILLADIQDPAAPETGPELQRISDIVSNPNFGDQQFLNVLAVAEDYNVRPKFVVSLIQAFLRGKGTEYGPRRGIIAAWLRAAVKLQDVGLMKDILELGDATVKLSAIVEAWDVADKIDDCLEKLGIRLVGAVANPKTREADFIRALDVIKEVGVNQELVARVCSSFLANRDAGYIPNSEIVRMAIEAFIHADKVDEAFALLHRVGIQSGKRPIHRKFLANLRDSRPLDHHSFSKLLSAVDAAGIPLDTSLFNVLIAREVRLNRAVNALSMFDEMKKNPHLSPDSYTFGSLFSMYRGIRPRSVRYFSRAQTMAIPTYPLRELFCELVESSKRVEKPVRPNTTLLNTALRAFMRQRDYAGALTVINSYGLFQVPLDNKSYYSVVKLLIRRVWAEVQGSRLKETERWVDRFLGVEHYSDIVLSTSLVHEIFTVLRRKDFDVSLPIHLPRASRFRRLRHLGHRNREEEHSFPTIRMMESLELPEPVDFYYDPVPLIRLLSRAIFADAVVHPEEASRKVDDLVRRAESEMMLDLM